MSVSALYKPPVLVRDIIHTEAYSSVKNICAKRTLVAWQVGMLPGKKSNMILTNYFQGKSHIPRTYDLFKMSGDKAHYRIDRHSL